MSQHQQQHLRGLRRGVNKAVTTLKEGRRLLVHSGWGHGRAVALPGEKQELSPSLCQRDLFFFYPSPVLPSAPLWRAEESLLPEALQAAADFFWPGPLAMTVRWPGSRVKVHLACPWHPLLAELLARHGPCLWSPLSAEEERRLEELRRKREVDTFEGDAALIWPDREVALPLTRLDASTRPWRWTESGFVEHDELLSRISEPLILSAERAFPVRRLQVYVPGYKTVVVEAVERDELPDLVKRFREKVGPEWSIRVYLDEATAHAHFPDDRSVRVYGEMGDPERVRRRLEAMLERQRRRSGKRILLIAVSTLPPAADSLKSDLQKLADRWIVVPRGGGFEFDDFAS